MRIAKTSKILFVIAAFALSLSLIFSLTGTANVSADGVSALSYFGGTATSVFSGGKLTVKAENDETLSVINKLAIDDFKTKFTVDANVNTVTLTLTSDSDFGAGVVLDPADENSEIVKSVENVILLDYANSKFSLNGTEKPLSGRETELALSVSEKGVLSVTIGVETVSVSADDDTVHFVIDLCRHLSGFADQLIGNRVDVAAFLFDKNQKIAPYILIKRARLLLEADRFFRTSADA